MSSALPLINIYVCTKFNFNPVCTFQDSAQTVIHYESNDYGEITLYIYRVRLWVLCTTLPPSIYKQSFISIPFVPFPDISGTCNTYEKWLRVDNTVNIQGTIMVLVHSTSPHCHICIYQVW